MTSSRFGVCAALVCLAAIAPLFAQATQPPQPQPPAAATPPAPTGPPGLKRLHYGVRFGPSFTTLSSVDAFDETAAAAAFEPTMNFGGFVNLKLSGAMSFQPEILF